MAKGKFKRKTRHKYKVIVKVACCDKCNDKICSKKMAQPCTLCHRNCTFKTWNTSHLVKLCEFLDSKHSTWRWFNVYDKKTRNQVGNFTAGNRPQNRWIE